MVNRRVDDAVIGLGIAPDMGQQRVLAIIARPIVVFHTRMAFSDEGAARRESGVIASG